MSERDRERAWRAERDRRREEEARIQEEEMLEWILDNMAVTEGPELWWLKPDLPRRLGGEGDSGQQFLRALAAATGAPGPVWYQNYRVVAKIAPESFWEPTVGGWRIWWPGGWRLCVSDASDLHGLLAAEASVPGPFVAVCVFCGYHGVRGDDYRATMATATHAAAARADTPETGDGDDGDGGCRKRARMSTPKKPETPLPWLPVIKLFDVCALADWAVHEMAHGRTAHTPMPEPDLDHTDIVEWIRRGMPKHCMRPAVCDAVVSAAACVCDAFGWNKGESPYPIIPRPWPWVGWRPPMHTAPPVMFWGDSVHIDQIEVRARHPRIRWLGKRAPHKSILDALNRARHAIDASAQ